MQEYHSDYRMTLLLKCQGLDAEQLARWSVPPSTMSLIGLVRHPAEVERDWCNWVASGPPLPSLYGGNGADFGGSAPDQALVEAAYADLAREQANTDAVIAEHPDLGERVGSAGIAIRELLVHRIEEYARHCGHPDLLRECIDGRVGPVHPPSHAASEVSEPGQPYRIIVDGELWQVRARGDGHHDFTWLSGLAPNYGFTSSVMGPEDAMTHEAIEASIRNFMSNVNPTTGYLD